MADYVTDPEYSSVNLALSRLEKIILDTLDFKQVVQKVVDSMLFELDFLNLGYRIMVLSLIDAHKNVLKRVSISQTEEAKKATGGLPMSFTDVEIPMTAKENICIKTMLEKKPMHTYEWSDILTPPLSKAEAIDLQQKVGIKTSVVYPLIVNEKPIGMMIFSMVKDIKEISESERMLLARFTDLVAMAVQNAKLYSSVEETKNKLAKANIRLQELDKLKDEFVSVTSHELRTPLTAIRSYLWLALQGRGGHLSDKLKYYLDRSYNSTVRLIKLVNDILNISRIESGRMSFVIEKIDLIKLTNEVFDEVRPRAEELKIKLSMINYQLSKNKNQGTMINDQISVGAGRDAPAQTAVGSRELFVIGDADKIKEILINLIGNALKFVPENGLIQVGFEEKDDEIITEVTDNGEGIEQEDIPKLFHKFGMIQNSYITNQKAAQGTGLGLYICKSIIEKLGGQIWVTSPGKKQGTTLYFSLKKHNPELLANLKKKLENPNGLGIVHSEV